MRIGHIGWSLDYDGSVNRGDRRRLQRLLATPGPFQRRGKLRPGVQLVGGPMDGVYVKLDAPALDPDWWSTMPNHLKARHAPVPGRYVRIGPDEAGVEQAEWREVDQEGAR